MLYWWYPAWAQLPSRPCSNALVTHPATNWALRCLTSQHWPDTLRAAVKASSYSEAVCVSYNSCGTHYHYTRSHIHWSPCRFYYGLNLTDDQGKTNFRSLIQMHYIHMIKYYLVWLLMHYGKLRTNTDCHEWCRIVTVMTSQAHSEMSVGQKPTYMHLTVIGLNWWTDRPKMKNLPSSFVCFVALRPKSTAVVMAGLSVHLTTVFPWQAWTSS